MQGQSPHCTTDACCARHPRACHQAKSNPQPAAAVYSEPCQAKHSSRALLTAVLTAATPDIVPAATWSTFECHFRAVGDIFVGSTHKPPCPRSCAWRFVRVARKLTTDRWGAFIVRALRTVWAHLGLLRLQVDAASETGLECQLARAGELARRSQIAQALAYFHECASIVDGQRGRLDSAWRHCASAESLLAQDPSLALQGTLLLNRSCLRYLGGDYEGALLDLQYASTWITRSGLATQTDQSNGWKHGPKAWVPVAGEDQFDYIYMGPDRADAEGDGRTLKACTKYSQFPAYSGVTPKWAEDHSADLQKGDVVYCRACSITSFGSQ